LVGRRVSVGGFPAVVGTKPGHLQTAEERRQAPPFEDLYIDIGFDSADEVRSLGIDVGTPITYVSQLEALANPDRFNGKAIDNRIGCAMLLHLFRALGGKFQHGLLTGVVAVQEEVGLRGATVAARRVNPDYAVVIDTFPVGDTPDVKTGRMAGAIGKGPVTVLVAQGRSGGHISNQRVLTWLREAAHRKQVPLQAAVSVGYAVTDAASVHLRQQGIPTAVLGLPRRYSHSPICTFDINDAVDLVKVLEAFVDAMPDHQDFGFL
jgi:putative aminopeptidase FrvX